MSNVYTVLQINRYIKHMMNSDILLSGLSVEGEVSNTVFNRSGHIYFTLKDENSSLNCVMFAGSRSGLNFPMKDGDSVVVSGRVNVYEKAGSYQLYANKITRAGTGILYERFLALKADLEERGMFSPYYKKPIPFFPRTIGIVTAATGAAIRDIANITKRRNPGIQLILYPAIVQGERAAASIARGIGILDAAGVDVIIAGRGGGSIEDLWAFNEEEVAYAIFNCDTPVISAVGHETDFTIADFVADLRAPTPSAAAELAVPDVFETIEQLNSAEKRLSFLMDGALRDARFRKSIFEKRLNALSPENQVIHSRERVNVLNMRIRAAGAAAIENKRYRLGIIAERLDGLSPLKKLSGGFSFVNDEQGKAVTSVKDIHPGNQLFINVTDGSIQAEAKKITKAVGRNGEKES